MAKEIREKKNKGHVVWIPSDYSMDKYLFIIGLIFLIGCSDAQELKRPIKSTYVPPTINYKGQFRKGYVRKSVSTNPNTIRNQSKSKYYYKTKGKYMRNRNPKN